MKVDYNPVARLFEAFLHLEQAGLMSLTSVSILHAAYEAHQGQIPSQSLYSDTY